MADDDLYFACIHADCSRIDGSIYKRIILQGWPDEQSMAGRHGYDAHRFAVDGALHPGVECFPWRHSIERVGCAAYDRSWLDRVYDHRVGEEDEL